MCVCVCVCACVRVCVCARVARGAWRVARVAWRVAFGVWCVACGASQTNAIHFAFSWFTTWMWSVVEYLLLNLVCYHRFFSLNAFSSLFVSPLVNTL